MASDPGLALAFAAGLASFLTPCVLPVLPGFLAVAAGGTDATRGRRLARSGAFVAGFGAVFVLLGLALGAVAATAPARTAQTLLERVGGTLVIVFGLQLTGLLRLPYLDRTLRLDVGPAAEGSRREAGLLFSGLLGAAFAVGWTPCTGPVLASVLVVAGLQGGSLAGGGLLAAYAAGLGLPFLLVGAGGQAALDRLQGRARLARGVEAASGVVLVVLGVFVFTGSLARALSYVRWW
jgi:cytochrome c-type biogenesis protein